MSNEMTILPSKVYENGLSMDKNKITFVDWMIEWLEVYSRPNIRESTYASYHQRIYGHIIPAFPKVLLKDLRTDMLQKFFNEKAKSGRKDKLKDKNTGEFVVREGGLSNAVLQTMKKIINCALKQAIQNDIITKNPISMVKLPRQQKNEVQILTLEEQKQLEANVMGASNRLAFGIFLDLYTGLRIGELLALKLDDIDFDKKELNVRRSIRRVITPNSERKSEIMITEPKTAKGKRTIPIPEFIVGMWRIIYRREQTGRIWLVNIGKTKVSLK